MARRDVSLRVSCGRSAASWWNSTRWLTMSPGNMGHESATGCARIYATLGVNEVLSVQVTYHPGWKAMAGARAVPISKDGLGEMIVSPGRPGEYDISLVYDGGWESMLCRALSAIALLAVTIAVFRWRFTAVAH